MSYTVNSLNQHVDILTPGEKEIMGIACANNSVAVNGSPADRKGQYFHREISVANTNAPVWQSVTNISGVFTNKGGAVFPANNQVLAYDADGNLSSDGVWFYQWDGENRLICMTTTSVYTAQFYKDSQTNEGGYADLDACLAAMQISQGSKYAGLDTDASLGIYLDAEDGL